MLLRTLPAGYHSTTKIATDIDVFAGDSDIDFLKWLADTVSKAAQTAEEHQALQGTVNELCTAIEIKYKLFSLQVGPCSLCALPHSKLLHVQSSVKKYAATGCASVFLSLCTCIHQLTCCH